MVVNVNFVLNESSGESLNFIADGELQKLADCTKLTFIEQTDLKLKTELYIYKDMVELKRYGKVTMSMEYNLSKETNADMNIDGFEISMLCTTNFLDIKKDRIEVIYQTELDRENDITHQLMISWQ